MAKRHKTLTVYLALQDYMADDQNVTLDVGGEWVTGKAKTLLRYVDESVLRCLVQRIGYGDCYNVILYIDQTEGVTDDAS